MRRIEWLPAAGGDLIGMGSSEHADLVVAAVETFATTGHGLLGLDSSSDPPNHHLHEWNAPYRVLVRVSDDVVVVVRVLER